MLNSLIRHFSIVIHITFDYISYFSTPLVPESTSLLFYAPWTLFGIYLLFNLFFNWHMCAFVESGSPPFPANYYNAESPSSSEFPTCKKCRRLKPPRTHHCSICNKYVLAMDHHCPKITIASDFTAMNVSCCFRCLLDRNSSCFSIDCLWIVLLQHCLQWLPKIMRQNSSRVLFTMIMSGSILIAFCLRLYQQV